MQSVAQDSLVFFLEGQRNPNQPEHFEFLLGEVSLAQKYFSKTLHASGAKDVLEKAAPVWQMSKEATLVNALHCRSDLIAGLGGDQNARVRYEEARVTSLATLPGWLAELILQKFSDNYHALVAMDKTAWLPKLPKGFSYADSDKHLVANPIESFLGFFGLVQSPTFVGLQELLATVEAADYRYKARFQSVWQPALGQQSANNDRQFIECYSPLEDSPYGEVARRDLANLTDILHRGLILNDLLISLNLEISPATLERILDKKNQPAWELSNTRHGRNLIAIASYINQKQPAATDFKTELEQRIFAKNPLAD